MVRQRLWLGYLAAALVVAVVYLRSGSLEVHAALMTALGVSSALASFGAILLWRPARRSIWILIGLAQSVEVIGTALFYRPLLSTGRPPTPGSVSDPFFIMFYVLFAFVLIALLRRRGSSRAAVLDAALLAVAGAVPIVLILVEPYLASSGVSVLGKAVQIASAFGDVILAAVFLRLVAAGGRHSPALLLLFAAVPCFLASDVIWNWLTLLHDFQLGSWGDSGWLLAFILTGAASLHPSMVGLQETEQAGVKEKAHQPALGKLYVVILGAALFVSPALRSAEQLSGRNFGSLTLLGLLSALAVLVLVRVAGAVRESERLRLEVAVQNDRLRELDRMKDEFVASVSHELRTPLTSISGYLEILRDDRTLGDEQERILEIVDRNADRLQRLVADLLFVANAEDAAVIGEKSEVDLTELARDALEAARARASTGKVTLELHGGPALLRGDPMRLSQVIDNLISNAIKFTPAGGQVHVRVDLVQERALLTVSDTGMGIPDEEQADLFQRFFRTRGANEAAIQGTGLGLSIAKQIVESHGGTIDFTSSEASARPSRLNCPPARRSAAPRRASTAASASPQCARSRGTRWPGRLPRA
jgi:signal transduction histidine kinase